MDGRKGRAALALALATIAALATAFGAVGDLTPLDCTGNTDPTPAQRKWKVKKKK